MAIDQVQLVGGGRGALCVLAMGTLSPSPSCPTPAHLPVSPIGYSPPSGLGAGEAWEMGFGTGGGSHLRNTRGPLCCCSPQKPTCRPSCSVFLVLSSFSPPPAPPPPGVHQESTKAILVSRHPVPPEGSTLSFPACSLIARRSQLQGAHPGLRARPLGRL